MNYYVMLYYRNSNNELVECLGSDCYTYLDGRLSLFNKKQEAKAFMERKNKFRKGYAVGYQVRKATSNSIFLDYRALTEIIIQS